MKPSLTVKILNEKPNDRALNIDTTYLVINEYFTSDSAAMISIPEQLSRDGQRFRQLYLNYIDQIKTWVPTPGEGSMENILAGLDDMPYWFTSVIHEKCNWKKSPNIQSILKFFVITEQLRTICPNQLVLEKKIDRPLKEVLVDFCYRNGISVNFEKKNSKYKNFHLNFLFFKYLCKTLVWLLWFFWKNLFFIFSKVVNEKNTKYEHVTIVTYLLPQPNSNVSSQDINRNYWGKLPSLLSNTGVKTHWIYLVQINKQKDASLTIDQIRSLNSLNEPECHSLLEADLSLWLLISAVIDYSKLVWRAKNTISILDFVDNFDIGALLRNDVLESIYGPTLIKAVIYRKLFDNLFKSRYTHEQKRASLVLYLHENIPWEHALLHTARQYNAPAVVGVAHSSLRYWDLRYARSLQDYQEPLGNVSLPDSLVVNSFAAKKILIDDGAPDSWIELAEGLRSIPQKLCDDLDYCERIPRICSENIAIITIFGEYSKELTKDLITLVSTAIGDIEAVVYFKPHPTDVYSGFLAEKEGFIVVNQDSAAQIVGSDVVITGAHSTIALEAMSLGKPTFVVRDKTGFSMSPVLNIESAVFVSNGRELRSALEALSNRAIVQSADIEDIRILSSSDLGGWNELLKRFGVIT